MRGVLALVYRDPTINGAVTNREELENFEFSEHLMVLGPIVPAQIHQQKVHLGLESFILRGVTRKISHLQLEEHLLEDLEELHADSVLAADSAAREIIKEVDRGVFAVAKRR